MNDTAPTGRPTLEAIKSQFLGKKVSGSRSAAGDWLGFTLVAIEKGRVVFSLPVKKDLTNPFGNLHGGAMALIMDEAIGWCVLSLEAPQYYTTLNLNVDFLYSATAGEIITAEATVIRHGKKIVHAECRIFNAAGMLLGKAAGNLIATGMALAT